MSSANRFSFILADGWRRFGKVPHPERKRGRVKKVFDEAANPVQIVGQMSESSGSGTGKAIAIIVFMLVVLASLLCWANYMRPHP